MPTRPATRLRTDPREGDPLLGQPLCRQCYDYATHVVWQWWAPDLWRRLTIALHRMVARTLGVPATRLAEVATVQYAKVAEYQLRGAVHFHALFRLDGPRTTDGFAPAPIAIDADRLSRPGPTGGRLGSTDRVRESTLSDPARVLAFGRQLDARPVRTGRRTDDPDRPLSPEQVAGYLAKYATKSAAGHRSHRRPPTTNRSGPPPATSPAAPEPHVADPPRRTPTDCSASGCTCSGSGATSRPSRGATR